jgi:hypothetical protein
MQFIASFTANLLQRAFGSKPNTMLTVTGLIAAIAAGLATFPPAALPVKYQPYLVAVAGFAGALAGILGHGQNATLPPAS